MTKKILQINLYLILIILLTACGNTENPETNPVTKDWEQVLSQQIKLLGHRNWIVVADAAYPLQSKNGITTLESNIDHFKTIEKVKEGLNPTLNVLGILPVMIDKRRKLSTEVRTYIEENFDIGIDLHLMGNFLEIY